MKRLTVKAYTPICKTENGATGTTSRMLKLDDYVEHENEKKNVQLRLIKGLKGWLRHKYMEYYLKKGVEVCYSSAKGELKDRPVKIPNGFHKLGDCRGECPIYQIFGGVIPKKETNSELSKTSKISVWANPFISKARFKKQEEKVQEVLKQRFPVMSFNVENNVALGYKGDSLQQFGKEFFSGDFDIFIDVSRLNEEEFKILLEVLLTTKTQLGGSKTSGCGQIDIKEILYYEIKERIILLEDGKIGRKDESTKLELPKLELTA